jgi:hypothetical protein
LRLRGNEPSTHNPFAQNDQSPFRGFDYFYAEFDVRSVPRRRRRRLDPLGVARLADPHLAAGHKGFRLQQSAEIAGLVIGDNLALVADLPHIASDGIGNLDRFRAGDFDGGIQRFA